MENHKQFQKVLKRDRRWHFFLKWYLSAWEGKDSAWAILSEVAQINLNVWQSGLDHVSQTVDQIEAKHALIDLLKQIPGDAGNTSRNRYGIGGNAPPEPIDDIDAIAIQLTDLLEGVAALRAETRAEQPTAERVSAAIALLVKGLRACLDWLGRKGDFATDATITALAKWGVPLGGAYLLTNPAKLEALIEAARNWLAFL